MKVATKGSIRDKKLSKFRFSGCFSKTKVEECDQNVLNVFYQFGITIPCSATYFLNKYIVNLSTLQRGIFSWIIIIMFHCDGESLKLCNFSLELSKMFYLQTVQANTICVFSWKGVLKVIPKFHLFHGFVTRELQI